MLLSSRPRPILLAGLLLVVLAGAVFFWLALREQQRLHNVELTQQTLTDARLVRAVVRAQWPNVDAGCAASLLRTLDQEGVWVAILAAEGGRALYSAREGELPAFDGAPEVQRALRVGWGTDTRRLGPGETNFVTVAVSIGRDLEPVGLVWLARPVWTITDHPAAFGRSLAVVGVVALVAIGVALLVFFRLRRRVFQRVIQMARGLSTGDLSTELQVDGSDEMVVLSSALNALRRRLASQVETIDRQRRMLQLLVDHLGEGVVVAGADGRIALINPAALRLLNMQDTAVGRQALIGRPVEACIRQHQVQQLLLGPLPSPDEGEGAGGGSALLEQTYFQADTPRGTMHLLARVSELDLAEHVEDVPRAPGRVIVLTDITELERAIEVRTDFVANASHELRTPLSTIRAAIETLLSLDLRSETESAHRFLEKIDRHSERLQQMVADLLDLSRLESPTERFTPEPLDVRRLLHELHFRMTDTLERKQVRWRTELHPPDLHRVVGNPHLLRLVLDNLVDNAVKFTEAGGEVLVAIRRSGSEVVFEVADEGCGIPVEDQKRVFERFYQVQRARAGAERGTGLGLSIVRHAVGAMQGRVELHSGVGVGTRVVVSIPQPAGAMSGVSLEGDEAN